VLHEYSARLAARLMGGARARQELLHHAGAGAEYRRLSERLSPQRLALAWPHVCTRMRGEGRAERAATFIATQPAMVACIAEALPEMAHLDTLIVMGAQPARAPGFLQWG